QAYGAATGLQVVQFLVTRAKGDIEVGLEAILAGQPGVVCDAMRDLMELELLLDDFRHDPSAISDWLTLDEKARLRQFSPDELRKRFAKRVGADHKTLGITACYKMHSKLLHVTPGVAPLGRGVVESIHWAEIEICFGEVFEHARRTLYAIYR